MVSTLLWLSLAALSLMIVGCTATMLATAFLLSTGHHEPRSNHRRRTRSISLRVPLLGSSDSNANDANSRNEEIERLKESASILRAQAMAAQVELASKRTSSVVRKGDASPVKAVEYDNVADSCWEITYRFASEPESKSNQDPQQTQQRQPRTFYTGKIRLQFRSDGYTSILEDSSDHTDKTQNSKKLVTFQKVWGWDVESSAEDSLDYLLFSADVVLPPPIDENSNNKISTSERFYFQARVDTTKTNRISLEEGSVTVKRNIESGTGGWWGLFRGADGILAEFRSVGEFRSRAIPSIESQKNGSEL
ncbi:hypothetical protein HJC23_006284 [Cyclotella cryptica]|uniref:Plastid lipid-associated protein/fibrillin conserved domain-containing protein n=1 Tax=Cyclotella cryptica TaxID=29204 RepID=A0ABD3P3K4_9STRA|eukprot:CCRYP_018134-RA/>CCRYP_018134-RA protein AED:0.03 eAED:0.03 QI:92/1/1/1/1/1/2/1491/306